MRARRIPRTFREEQQAAGTTAKRSGASTAGPRIDERFTTYLLRHAQTLVYALGQLSRKPFSSLMTTAVIGIALALPAGLYVLLDNAQGVTRGLDGATQISLFLRQSVGPAEARELAARIRREHTAVGAVDYVSSAEAMAEFRRLSGFGEALDVLDENPLPEVLVVRPSLLLGGPEAVETLLGQLRALPEVDMAQLDMYWVKRLYALMAIGQRGVSVLGVLLALAVLLVVGNTIRLMIQNRRDEIVITKLIGGTDAFIRRPFLYSGFWYGFGGGIVALLLVEASLLTLAGPVRDLAGLYQSDFTLSALDVGTALALPGGGALLGLLGSWLAVGRHLRAIEPT